MWDIAINCSCASDKEQDVIVAYFIANSKEYKRDGKKVIFFADSVGNLMDTLCDLSEFMYSHGVPDHYSICFCGTKEAPYVFGLVDNWDS